MNLLSGNGIAFPVHKSTLCPQLASGLASPNVVVQWSRERSNIQLNKSQEEAPMLW